MKRIGLFIALFAFLSIVLPPLTAQDGKKDAAKDDKKADPAKDDKKDDTKDDKKVEPKKAEKFVYGARFITKIVSMGGGTNREFTVEVYEPDPQKIFDYNRWVAQRTQELTRQQFQAATQKDFNARVQGLANYQRDLANFQIDSAKRASNLKTAKPLEVYAAEKATVRTMLPPVEFDDLGFQKKWTKKELDERRDKTGLPGFAVDFDALKQGQYVEIYLTKKMPTKKGSSKKGPADDDPPAAKTGQEFVLIVIRQETGK